MDLLGSLGLDKVEADPNALPDGPWRGVISKAEWKYSSKKDTLSLVIYYKVTVGEKAGAVRDEWWTLGEKPIKDENGKYKGVENVTMNSQRKSFFKDRLQQLGIPESRMNDFDPIALVGIEVNFVTKKNGDWINVQKVERIDGLGITAEPKGSTDPFETGYLDTPSPTGDPSVPSGTDIGDLI